MFTCRSREPRPLSCEKEEQLCFLLIEAAEFLLYFQIWLNNFIFCPLWGSRTSGKAIRDYHKRLIRGIWSHSEHKPNAFLCIAFTAESPFSSISSSAENWCSLPLEITLMRRRGKRSSWGEEQSQFSVGRSACNQDVIILFFSIR